MIRKVILNLLWGLGVCQSAFAIDELEARIQRLSKALQQNAKKIENLKQEELKQQKQLLKANQKLEKSYEPLVNAPKNNRESLLARIKYQPIEPSKRFFPHLQFETADHKNTLSINPYIGFNSDIFSDMQGLRLNTGVDSPPILRKNTVIRNWLNAAGFIMQSTLNQDTHFVFIPSFSRNQAFLLDGHFSVEQYKLFSLRAGYQTSLVSGLGTLLPSYLTYAGFTTNMAPSKEYGVVLYGSLGENHDTSFNRYNYLGYKHQFSYQFGIFNGTSDGTFPGLNPLGSGGRVVYLPSSAFAVNKSFEGRLFYQPFLGKKDNFFEHLGVGLGASTQKPNAQSLLPFIFTIGQNVMFGYANGTTYVVSSRTRYHPQLFWYKKQMGVYADWAQTTQYLTATYPSPVLKPAWVVRQTNKASEVQVFYNLTGEEFNTNGYIKPKEDFKFFQKGGGKGAFQVFARFTSFVGDPSTYSQSFKNRTGVTQYYISDPRLSVAKATGWSVGLNWFWNTFFSMRTEFAQTKFIGGCSSGAYNDPVSPGCLTADPVYFMAPSSKVINRPDEYVAMQSLFFMF
jgi:phosphate-selective porin OprO/OprP